MSRARNGRRWTISLEIAGGVTPKAAQAFAKRFNADRLSRGGERCEGDPEPQAAGPAAGERPVETPQDPSLVAQDYLTLEISIRFPRPGWLDEAGGAHGLTAEEIGAIQAQGLALVDGLTRNEEGYQLEHAGLTGSDGAPYAGVIEAGEAGALGLTYGNVTVPLVEEPRAGADRAALLLEFAAVLTGAKGFTASILCDLRDVARAAPGESRAVRCRAIDADGGAMGDHDATITVRARETRLEPGTQ